MFNDSNGSLAFDLPAFKTEFQYHCDFQVYDKAPFLIHNEYSFDSSFFFSAVVAIVLSNEPMFS